jgi:hypothetical protein
LERQGFALLNIIFIVSFESGKQSITSNLLK